MIKKQTFVVTGLVILSIGAIVGAGYYAKQTFFATNKATVVLSSTTGSDTTTTLTPQNSESISLNPKKATSEDSGGLSVNDSANMSSNLGSGSRQTISSSQNSSQSAESFAEYEKYKDKNEVFYGDMVVGTGAEAVKDKQLAVTYKGYLTTGQVFDQSRAGNNGQLQPLLFTLGGGQLIPGFEQGVAGMKVGGVRRVIIPPSLGYGENAQGSIPANSVLIFDIALTAAQ